MTEQGVKMNTSKSNLKQLTSTHKHQYERKEKLIQMLHANH